MKDKGKLVRHESCSDCGSRDNRAIYIHNDNTHSYYCFGCQSHGIIGENPNTEYEETEMTEYKDIEGYQTRGIKERRITKYVAEFYGLKVATSPDDPNLITHHYYPNTLNGEVVGYQERDVEDKRFKALGNCKNGIQLQGQHLFAKDSGPKLVITEGFLDMLSVSQAIIGDLHNHGRIYPCVSLPNGVGSVDAVANNIEWVESFKEVIIFMDNDVVGKEAAEKISMMITPGKAKICELHKHKDASDALISGDAELIKRAIYDAEAPKVSGLVNSADTWGMMETFKKTESIPFAPCLQGLNDTIYGKRFGEITVLSAGSGIGKTSFLMEDLHHTLTTTDYKVGFLGLEESITSSIESLMSLHMNSRLKLDKDDEYGDDHKRAWKELLGDNRVTFYDSGGDVSKMGILGAIRTMVIQGCQLIILDHITLAVSGSDKGDSLRAADELMEGLLQIVKGKLPVHILAVSHLRKQSGDRKGFEEGSTPTADSLKGSGSIKQVAFSIIALSRDHSAEDDRTRNTTQLTILKDRFSGYTGSAGAAYYNSETGRLNHVASVNPDQPLFNVLSPEEMG